MTFSVPPGEDVLDVLDRITSVVVSTPAVESVHCLDRRPLDDLRQQMSTSVTTRLQQALDDLNREMAEVVDDAFKRGVTTVLGQS